MLNPVTRSACAKIILCGEHSVVYGRPAIALPLPNLRAFASVTPRERSIRIEAPDINAGFMLYDKPDHPLARVVSLTLDHLQPTERATFTLSIRSDIPVISHLGSGAAVSVACARAIATYFGSYMMPHTASELAYEVEKIYHGTPSGIDNTVIAYEQPVWFVRGAQPTLLEGASATDMLNLVIGDTGIATPTRIPVSEVRHGWEKDPPRFEALFDEITSVVVESREALAAQNWPRLGGLMNRNHELLQSLGVSCAELDELCDAARAAGALGAKMSGGGQGGNIIALARDAIHAAEVRTTIMQAGARRVL
jgi:mevalonate kinase